MKIVDMRPSEDGDKDGESPVQSSYGQRIHVEGKKVDELGLKGAKAGTEHDIQGKVKILSVRVPEDGEGDEGHRIELHVTHLGVGEPKEPSLRDQIKKAADKPPAPKATKKK